MRRLYVLINKNLNPVYGCVQGGHAVAQWLLEHPDQTWNNSYLIYLKCNLYTIKKRLIKLQRDFSEFKEPDLGNEITAIAIEDNGKLFKNLKLIS
jgi:hypothetical protein